MVRHGKPLRRSHDAYLAGVIGGIAEYFGLDPSLCRVVYVILSVLSAAFPGMLVYVILWILIPRREEEYWP
jgi:phage shock protein C